MAAIRALKFEVVGDGVKLTSYALAARGRKFRQGAVVIKDRENVRKELKNGGLKALGGVFDPLD